MINKLSNTVKIPYNQVRGSIIERQEKANKLVEKLAENLKPEIKDGKLHISKLQECVHRILPKNLDVRIDEGFSTDYLAFCDVLHNDLGEISATTMIFRTVNHYISSQLLESIMHEFQHVADQIYHPKYLSRIQYMLKTGMYTNKYLKLYENIIYTPEWPAGKKDKGIILKRMEHKIKNFIKNYTAEDKMNYIQDARYGLKMEKEAYSVQNKYADKKEDFNNIFMFDEKLNLLKRIGAEIIQKERYKLSHKRK